MSKEFLDFEGLSHYHDKLIEFIEMSDDAILDYFGVDPETGSTDSIENSAYAKMIKDAVIEEMGDIDTTISIPEEDINNLFS